MKPPALSRLNPTLADLASRQQLWTWSAIIASMLVGVFASLLHFRQQWAIGEITEAITTMRQARIELAKGFLYVSLSGDPGAPFDRDEGLALLRQATSSLEGAMKTTAGVVGDPEMTIFKQQLGLFQSALEEYSALAEPDAKSKTNLRIAFHNLERQAEQVDEQSHRKLQELGRSLNFEFGLAVSISAVLLLGICVIVFFTNRAKEKSDAALLEREQKLNELLNILPVGISILNEEKRVVFSNSALRHILQLTEDELASGAYKKRRYIQADGTPMPSDQFASNRAIEAGEPVFGVETGIVKGDGEIIWGDVSAVPVDFPNWKTVVVTSDITERKRAGEAIRLYNERLTSVVEIEHNLASILDQGSIYKTLADGVQQIFPDMTTIFISSFDAEREMIRAEYGIHEGQPVDISSLPELKLAPNGEGTQSRVIRSAQPLIVQDHLKEHLNPQKTTRIGSGAEDTQSALYVPMIAQQKVLGLIQVQSLIPNRFSASDVQSLSLIANTAAVSIENARLYEAAQTEIKERRQAEEALMLSEERYRLITENSADVIWVLDAAAGKFTYVSPSVKKMRGYTPEEVMEQAMEQVLTPESLRMVSASLKEQLPVFLENGGRPKSFVSEVDQLHKDGSIIHTEATTTYLLNDRNMVEIIGISRDITERKQAEEHIRASEQKYRSLSMELEKRVEERTTEIAAVRERLELAAQAAELGIWDWNIETGELFWDERMYSLYQVGREAFNGTIEAFMGFVHPEDLPQLMSLAQGITEIGAQGVTQYRITCGDGSIKHIKAHGIVQRNIRGEPSHIIGVVQDVTPEKEAQETLELVNMELKRASRMKDEFLASMSHELRTPLTGILGLAEALQLKTYGNLDEKQLKTLRTIEESGRHLLDLINDILDLSKIEAGKLELQIEPCSLSEICQASLQLTRGMAQKKRQTMRYTASPQPLTVQADTRRLKQILVNLLSNAVKFTREGGELGLEVEADEAGRRVKLTVWDKGIGIKPENIKMLFSPFTQIDSSLAREYSGTGLGLSLVQRLVKLHQGSIEVQSVFGEGSRFTVSLPWIPQSITPVTGTTQSPTVKNTGPLHLRQGTDAPKIFVVDDNSVVLDMVGDYLEAKQYRVEKARSAFEFFERIAHSPPDLIIMDIQMAGMSGLDAIRSIRSRTEPAIAQIPIIAVTALAMSGDRERCLNAGANDYLSKPVSLKELAAVIKKLTGKYHE